MNDNETAEPKAAIALEYDLDAPPETVWRAISTPAFRARWLPEETLADPEATTVTPGEELRYRMRDAGPPYLESTVTFRIVPNTGGGTRLKVIHELDDTRLRQMTLRAANGNRASLMRAA